MTNAEATEFVRLLGELERHHDPLPPDYREAIRQVEALALVALMHEERDVFSRKAPERRLRRVL